MRKPLPLLLLIGAALTLGGAQSAEAGVFGGFTSDGSYRSGDDSLCLPVRSELGQPACSSKSRADFAKMGLSKGEKQEGSKKKVIASKSASKIQVRDAESNALLFSWDSGQVVNSTGAVYLHKQGQWVAVEFSYRMGGRTVEEVVVVQLATSLTGAAAPQPAPAVSPSKKQPPKVKAATNPPAFTEAMKKAAKWARRRKHKKAIAAYGEALAVLAEHPETLYRLARSQMASKNKSAAVATLARIPASKGPGAVEWRVEARFDIVFKSLRGDTDFRKAVGIERGADDPLTLYEKLVGFGGRWEQERIACEQPQVNLDLRRNTKHRFDLVIRSKCQGMTETTRLDGSWASSGDRKLGLTFPNSESADEDLSCTLELCSDDSGENCLRCSLDEDIEFLLRVVRR